MMDIEQKAKQAKAASIHLAAVSAAQKDEALGNIARALLVRKDEIINTNRIDLANAKADNLSPPLLKRLKFDESKIQEACEGLESLRRLPDPVGQTLRATNWTMASNYTRSAAPSASSASYSSPDRMPWYRFLHFA